MRSASASLSVTFSIRPRDIGTGRRTQPCQISQVVGSAKPKTGRGTVSIYRPRYCRSRPLARAAFALSRPEFSGAMLAQSCGAAGRLAAIFVPRPRRFPLSGAGVVPRGVPKARARRRGGTSPPGGCIAALPVTELLYLSIPHYLAADGRNCPRPKLPKIAVFGNFPDIMRAHGAHRTQRAAGQADHSPAPS